MRWFARFLGEQPGNPLTPDIPDAPVGDVVELAHGLDQSWDLMSEALARWSPDDMHKTFAMERRGQHYELSRDWVVWHVLEHDLHHGGEISLMLGMNGLKAPDV